MTAGEAMRVLITGAGGFVGQHLAKKLIEMLPTQAELLLTDRKANSVLNGTNVRFATLDVTQSRDVRFLIQSERPTHIVHLAAIAAVTAATLDVRRAWDVNFSGTQNIALAIAELLPECRLIFCSSAEVYGSSFKEGNAVDENALLQPVNAYGAAKAAADIALSQMALSGMRVLRLRPFNHTGPGQSTQFAIPAFAAQIARIERGDQEPIIRVGDLHSRRDFLHVEDVVSAYAKTLLQFDSLPNGAAINIAAGEALALSDALKFLISRAGVKIDVAIDPQLLRPVDMPLVLGNPSRARNWLGWQPTQSWEAMLDSVLNFWRSET